MGRAGHAKAWSPFRSGAQIWVTFPLMYGQRRTGDSTKVFTDARNHMGNEFSEAAASGPLALAIVVSALAGLASFMSPCVLPLIPGYIAYVTGLSDENDERRNKMRIFAGSMMFIVGFSLVFITAGVLATEIGRLLFEFEREVEVVGGFVVAALGLIYMGKFTRLQKEWRFRRLPDAGIWSAPLIGLTFALSWTPCIGPTLATVLQLAVVNGTQSRAVILSVAYCAGIGIPFVLFALCFRRLLGVFRIIRKHNNVVSVIGGALLIAVGVAIAIGSWNEFVIWLMVAVPVPSFLP